MDCGLEHLLLVVALLEELCCERAGLRVLLQRAALLLDFKLLLRWYCSHHPFTEFHLSGEYVPHVAHELPKVLERHVACADHEQQTG